MKHLWSENCNNSLFAKVNSEVRKVCSSAARKTDLKLQHTQKSSVASVILPTLLANSLLKLPNLLGEKSLSELMALKSDTVSLIYAKNRDVKTKRTDTIQPDLQAA